jgi:hypothetical protein
VLVAQARLIRPILRMEIDKNIETKRDETIATNLSDDLMSLHVRE